MAQTVAQKNWYTVVAPDLFDREELTETPAEDPEMVKGRRIDEDLSELMEGTDMYYVDVSLKVTEVEGNKAFTEIDGMECSTEFVSRMMRKRSDRMDLVADVETGDDRQVRVKVVGATTKNTSSKKLTDVRNQLEDILEEEASGKDYGEFMEAIFDGTVRERLEDAAEEIYPFRELEIRKTELLE